MVDKDSRKNPEDVDEERVSSGRDASRALDDEDINRAGEPGDKILPHTKGRFSESADPTHDPRSPFRREVLDAENILDSPADAIAQMLTQALRESRDILDITSDDPGEVDDAFQSFPGLDIAIRVHIETALDRGADPEVLLERIVEKLSQALNVSTSRDIQAHRDTIAERLAGRFFARAIRAYREKRSSSESFSDSSDEQPAEQSDAIRSDEDAKPQ